MAARNRRTAVVAGVVATAVLAALLAAHAFRPPQAKNDLAELVAAVGSNLPFEARLSAGFPPSAHEVKRSGGPTTTELSPDVQIAIAQIEKRAASGRGPKALGDLGVAYLVGGDVNKSIASLEEGTSIGDDATQWSDLSAAYLVKAERTPSRRIEYVSRALEAAAKSIHKAPSDAARFNYALAIEALSPYLNATNPWDDYVRTEHDARWLAEGQRRHDASKPPIDPGERWELRKTRLRQALDQRDRVFIEETASQDAEASVELFERELLVEWARLVLAHDQNSANRVLDNSRALADGIHVATGDSLPQRAIATILLAAGTDELARAHLAYAAGVSQYDANDYAASRASLERARAGFQEVGSPYADWATLQIATILFQARQLNGAEALVVAVEGRARRSGFQLLLGRALWLRGLIESKRWQLRDALNAFREAASIFTTIHAWENRANLDSVISANLRMLGEYSDSWDYSGRTLDGLSQVRKPIQRYLFLFNASLFASSQDLLEAALRFQNAALSEAHRAGDAPEIEALTQRAMILIRQKNLTEASRDLEAARMRLSAVVSESLKKYLKAEIDVLLAELAPAMGRRPPIDDLRNAIDFFTTAEPAIVPRLQLGLARAQLAAHENAQAEGAFTQGIALLERQQEGLADDSLKMSYFDESWNLFAEMIEFQSRERNDSDKAFAFAERARARSLLQGRAPLGLSEVQRALPDSTVMLYYATLSDRLLIWVITNRESRAFQRMVPKDHLWRLVSRYAVDVISGETDFGSGQDLYELLIGTVASILPANATMVFVADGELQRIPFATLRGGTASRYVIEDHPIVVAPSATFFVTGIARSKAFAVTSALSGLLVGDPEFTVTSARPRLPGAEAEANTAALFYAEHQVLTGPSATRARFLEMAPRFDVIHFGGHALANAEYPQLSRLLFAADRSGGDPEPLYAYEVAGLHWSHTRLVVLAACSTAAGAISHGEGVISVARPFLAAGVPVVVASQWDIEDRATQRLFVEFHREFARTHHAALSLQHAQIALLRSGNPDFAAPARWGAVTALGAGRG
jgi:CHAT domain-containing protein